MSRKRAMSPMLARLDAAVEAVWAADSAWYADLDSADAKAAYKAAKAAYKALADEAESKGVADDCRRCGGAGGWEGWPGYTCFDCGGNGLEPYRRARFQAAPATRAKKEAAFQAKRAVEEAAAAAKLAPFEAANAEAVAFLRSVKGWDEIGDGEMPRDDAFMATLKGKLLKYGSLSEKQVACVVREMEKRAETANATPFPAGSAVAVEGEIVSLPDTRGYGGKTKMNMLVKLSGEHAGNKVMGSIPEKVWRAMEHSDDDGRRHGSLIGSRVKFTAEFKRSDRDEHFGFFKSPKQVEVTHVEWKEASS